MAITEGCAVDCNSLGIGKVVAIQTMTSDGIDLTGQERVTVRYLDTNNNLIEILININQLTELAAE